jgi:hypothetical protein
MTSTPLLGPSTAQAVVVTGADRLSYLDAVLSQGLRDAVPGTSTAALELGPHGEPTGELRLAVLEDRVVLLVPSAAEGTADRLAGHTFLSDATFTTSDDAVLRLRGTADTVATLLTAVDLPSTPGLTAEADDVVVLVHHAGADLTGPGAALDTLTARLTEAGARASDEAELDGLEVALGLPRMPEEIARGRLPEELGLLPTHVHLAKGCYPGQEAVARMWMLGRPRRRLAVVAAPGDAAPGELGSGRTKVELTRVVDIDGRRMALALVPAATEVGDEPAEGVVVERFVGDGLPVPGHDPAVPRRRDR